MTREEFFNHYAPYAATAAAGTKIFPQVVILMAAHESGNGNSTLSRPPYFNFFGIKATNWTGKKVQLNTKEYQGGREVIVPQYFRDYQSPEQSFADFIKLISTQPRYAAALTAGTWQEQIVRIAAAGYATDPNYSQKVIEIGKTFQSLLNKIFKAMRYPSAGNMIESAFYMALFIANHQTSKYD